MTLKRHGVGAVAALLFVSCAGAQAPVYSVQVVPDPPVPVGREIFQRDLNGVLPNGRVVVTNIYNGGESEVFIGTDGDWQHFQPLPGDVDVLPRTFSSNGLAAGLSVNSEGVGHVVLWSDTVPTGLNPALLHYSGANGINSNGVVSGSTYNQQTQRHEAWMWRGGLLTNLLTPAGFTGAMASQTTLSGLTVGQATSGNQPPVIWHDGVPSLLTVPEGNLQWSFVSDINESGWVVGGRNYDGFGPSGVYLWREGQYELLRPSWLGFKAQLSNAGDVLFDDAWATSLWRDGVIYGPQDVLTPGFGGSVAWMQELLDDGRILGKVDVDGVIRNAVLTPIPSPGAVGLISLGVLVVWVRRRREFGGGV